MEQPSKNGVLVVKNDTDLAIREGRAFAEIRILTPFGAGGEPRKDLAIESFFGDLGIASGERPSDQPVSLDRLDDSLLEWRPACDQAPALPIPDTTIEVKTKQLTFHGVAVDGTGVRSVFDDTRFADPIIYAHSVTNSFGVKTFAPQSPDTAAINGAFARLGEDEVRAVLLGIDTTARAELRFKRLLWQRFDPSLRRDLVLRNARRRGECGFDSFAGLRIAPPDGLAPGTYYLGAQADVAFETGDGEPRLLRAVIAWDDASGAFGPVIALQALAAAAGVTGLAFPLDPVSATGDPTLGPLASEKRLDPRRHHVQLHRLSAPASPGAPQDLAGTYVEVVEDPALGIAPPTLPAGGAFNYHVESSDFAAVNAYHHLDAAFAAVFEPAPGGLGLDRDIYFGGRTAFPVKVMHRAIVGSGLSCPNGRCVNAQVKSAIDPTTGAMGVAEFRFALAARQKATGLAADPRFVWHEFCHALIIGATQANEFSFAHSAGDALGAIMCDPATKLAAPPGPGTYLGERGDSFPWAKAVPARRHDRDVALGWGWAGQFYQPRTPYDPHGYWAEQILSTTLFRLYRALGGDADGPAGLRRRAAAARLVLHLVATAIRDLGPALATPAVAPERFAEAMMNVDRLTADYVFQAHVLRGGIARKAIRWAFQQQGLYHDPGSPGPHDGPGLAEPVDLAIGTANGGGYAWRGDWTVGAEAIRIVHAQGTPGDQAPRVGQTNFVYVTVRNLGRDPVGSSGTATLRLRVANAAVAAWPDAAWTGAIGPLSVPALAPGASQEIELQWRPARKGKFQLLAEVSDPGDPSHIDPATALPCADPPAGKRTPLEWLVPYDNNLALRVVSVV